MKHEFSMTKEDTCWGDLTNITARKELLVNSCMYAPILFTKLIEYVSDTLVLFISIFTDD